MTALKISDIFYEPCFQRTSERARLLGRVCDVTLTPTLLHSLMHTQAFDPLYNRLSACARLGHKYKIGTLVEEVENYLREHFTTDFETWYQSGGSVPEGLQTIEAIGVVNIARLLKCNIILPTALLVCCTLDARELLSGFDREDGSQEKLAHDDCVRCVDGKRNLMQEISAAVVRAFAPFTTPECQTKAECHRAKQELLHCYGENSFVIANEYPFNGWTFYYKRWMGSDDKLKMCRHCRVQLQSRLYEEQKTIWQCLPTLLDVEVPDWDVGTPMEEQVAVEAAVCPLSACASIMC